jgi:type IV secretion system protein VirB11
MVEPTPFEGVYLRSYLRPFAPWLERPDVSEILVNRPGEVWVEIAGEPQMRRFEAPEVSDELMARLAAQVARASHQAVNRQSPLLAATLPSGERVQMAGPPATRRHWAMAIRRHLITELDLESYAHGPLRAARRRAREDDPAAAALQNPVAWLRQAVAARRTLLISGGTSSGKTTFLNTLLKIVPASERVILVEDTPEIVVRQPNALGLTAVKGDQGEARTTVDDLLQAALRLRPDRIIVGEIRGAEAATFLRAINTGHPGSFTTVHANSPEGALEQIALMVMQAGMTLPRRDILDYVGSVVDAVVQLGRVGGERRITDIRLLRAPGAAAAA